MAKWVAQGQCGPPNIPDLFVREGASSFLGRLKVASFQAVDRVVGNDFPVDDPVEKPRQMLAHLSGASLLAIFDKLIDQLMDMRPPNVVDGGARPAGHHMPAQDTVDVSP